MKTPATSQDLLTSAKGATADGPQQPDYSPTSSVSTTNSSGGGSPSETPQAGPCPGFVGTSAFLTTGPPQRSAEVAQALTSATSLYSSTDLRTEGENVTPTGEIPTIGGGSEKVRGLAVESGGASSSESPAALEQACEALRLQLQRKESEIHILESAYISAVGSLAVGGDLFEWFKNLAPAVGTTRRKISGNSNCDANGYNNDDAVSNHSFSNFEKYHPQRPPKRRCMLARDQAQRMRACSNELSSFSLACPFSSSSSTAESLVVGLHNEWVEQCRGARERLPKYLSIASISSSSSGSSPRQSRFSHSGGGPRSPNSSFTRKSSESNLGWYHENSTNNNNNKNYNNNNNNSLNNSNISQHSDSSSAASSANQNAERVWEGRSNAKHSEKRQTWSCSRIVAVGDPVNGRHQENGHNHMKKTRKRLTGGGGSSVVGSRSESIASDGDAQHKKASSSTTNSHHLAASTPRKARQRDKHGRFVKASALPTSSGSQQTPQQSSRNARPAGGRKSASITNDGWRSETRPTTTARKGSFDDTHYIDDDRESPASPDNDCSHQYHTDESNNKNNAGDYDTGRDGGSKNCESKHASPRYNDADGDHHEHQVELTVFSRHKSGRIVKDEDDENDEHASGNDDGDRHHSQQHRNHHYHRARKRKCSDTVDRDRRLSLTKTADGSSASPQQASSIPVSKASQNSSIRDGGRPPLGSNVNISTEESVIKFEQGTPNRQQASSNHSTTASSLSCSSLRQSSLPIPGEDNVLTTLKEQGRQLANTVKHKEVHEKDNVGGTGKSEDLEKVIKTTMPKVELPAEPEEADHSYESHPGARREHGVGNCQTLLDARESRGDFHAAPPLSGSLREELPAIQRCLPLSGTPGTVCSGSGESSSLSLSLQVDTHPNLGLKEARLTGGVEDSQNGSDTMQSDVVSALSDDAKHGRPVKFQSDGDKGHDDNGNAEPLMSLHSVATGEQVCTLADPARCKPGDDKTSLECSNISREARPKRGHHQAADGDSFLPQSGKTQGSTNSDHQGNESHHANPLAARRRRRLSSSGAASPSMAEVGTSNDRPAGAVSPKRLSSASGSRVTAKMSPARRHASRRRGRRATANSRGNEDGATSPSTSSSSSSTLSTSGTDAEQQLPMMVLERRNLSKGYSAGKLGRNDEYHSQHGLNQAAEEGSGALASSERNKDTDPSCRVANAPTEIVAGESGGSGVCGDVRGGCRIGGRLRGCGSAHHESSNECTTDSGNDESHVKRFGDEEVPTAQHKRRATLLSARRNSPVPSSTSGDDEDDGDGNTGDSDAEEGEEESKGRRGGTRTSVRSRKGKRTFSRSQAASAASDDEDEDDEPLCRRPHLRNRAARRR